MELFIQFVQILLFFPCFEEIGILRKKGLGNPTIMRFFGIKNRHRLKLGVG